MAPVYSRHARGAGKCDTDSEDEFFDDNLQKRRARWALDASARPIKTRKLEEEPRPYRYDHLYAKGDRRRRNLDPRKSLWWDLIEHPEVGTPGSDKYRKFRSKFRLPKPLVDKIMAEAQEHAPFADKAEGPSHGRGPGRHPLIIKVLAALRYLGKGVDYDTLEEMAHVSASLLKKFIPKFIDWYLVTFYPSQVYLPEGEELERNLKVYEKLGTPGAYAETDGTHVAWDACPAGIRARFVGKEGYPTIAFNVTVTHNKRVIHVAPWCAGAVNDQTQAQHDPLMCDLKLGRIHPEIEYRLYDEREVLIVHKGLYLIVDNGYHQWRCCQAPLKHAMSDGAAMWSERMESIRKAVECVFGIMKKRFRILRHAFTLRDPRRIESIFRMCCALHNMILEHDKLDSIGRLPGDWLDSRSLAGRIRTERERTRHVLRGPRNASAGGTIEAGHHVLRESLITHYTVACRLGRAGWLRTAAEVRPRDPEALAELEQRLAENVDSASEDELVYLETSNSEASADEL